MLNSNWILCCSYRAWVQDQAEYLNDDGILVVLAVKKSYLVNKQLNVKEFGVIIVAI